MDIVSFELQYMLDGDKKIYIKFLYYSKKKLFIQL